MIQTQYQQTALEEQENQFSSVCLHLKLPYFSYGNDQILGKIEFKILTGETIAITGRSGIGKTTLLRILAGLETNHSGTLTGTPKLGYVFQEPTLLPWRTVNQNLSLVAGIDIEQIEVILAKVELQTKGKLFPNQLSLGQQRRLALARAFALKPNLLLMDEPYVSLDSQLANEMMELFERLRSEYPVSTVLITHSQVEIDRLATRLLTLNGKPAILSGETD